MKTAVARLLDLLRRSVMLLPRAGAGLALGLAGRPDQARDQLSHLDHAAVWRLSSSLLLVPMGLVTLLGTFLATVDEVRLIPLFWLTDYILIGHGSIGPGTWGGPSLAGAWFVHAALGIVLWPVFVGVMLGLTRLAAVVVRGERPRWVLPVALLVDAAAIAFLVAFVQQL